MSSAAQLDLDALWRAAVAAGPSGLDAPPEDYFVVERAAGDGAAAYGELHPDSMAKLLRWLAPTPADALFDLGCGTGKVVLQAVCTTAVGRAVGVELSPFRLDAAAASRDRLLAAVRAVDPARADALAARVELRREDFRRTPLAPATIVYVGSTAMPDELLGQLAGHVWASAPRLRALVTTKALPDPWPARFTELGRVRVVASWSAQERVVVYARPALTASSPSAGP